MIMRRNDTSTSRRSTEQILADTTGWIPNTRYEYNGINLLNAYLLCVTELLYPYPYICRDVVDREFCKRGIIQGYR